MPFPAYLPPLAVTSESMSPLLVVTFVWVPLFPALDIAPFAPTRSAPACSDISGRFPVADGSGQRRVPLTARWDYAGGLGGGGGAGPLLLHPHLARLLRLLLFFAPVLPPEPHSQAELRDHNDDDSARSDDGHQSYVQ
ncbi:hypothetical protein B0H13DRAFT_2301569 [Mycena leptocephala]|nr:hypothetical protein B0H13DRAFT_2301569 [Mycena leptocephala]